MINLGKIEAKEKAIERFEKLERFEIKNIAYDKTAPCKDCPFKKTSPLHEGIGAEVAGMMTKLDEGTLAHTCHMTDPRTDHEDAVNYEGPVQHCAGAMIMMEKAGKANQAMFLAELNDKYDPTKLEMNAPIFTKKEMVQVYYDYLKKLKAEKVKARKKREKETGVKIHFCRARSYED